MKSSKKERVVFAKGSSVVNAKCGSALKLG